MAVPMGPPGHGPEVSTVAQIIASAYSAKEPESGDPVNPNNDRVSNSVSGLWHDPGISVNWSSEEQTVLEDLLVKYRSAPAVEKYAAIAMELKHKTARDVAFRCKWMSENQKVGRKDRGPANRSKDKRENATRNSETTGFAEDYCGMSYKDIGGITGNLLEQSSQMLDKVSANLEDLQAHHENIVLLSKTRDSLVSVLNNMGEMPEKKELLPLPRINENLASVILLYPPSPMDS